MYGHPYIFFHFTETFFPLYNIEWRISAEVQKSYKCAHHEIEYSHEKIVHSCDSACE